MYPESANNSQDMPCNKKDCSVEKNRGGYTFRLLKGFLVEIEGGEGRDPRHFKDMIRYVLITVIILALILLVPPTSVRDALLEKITDLIRAIKVG